MSNIISEAEAERWPQEVALFIASVKLLEEQFHKVLTEAQQKACWQRWKRERHLDYEAEVLDDATGLWKSKV
jgi:hypothetical protein